MLRSLLRWLRGSDGSRSTTRSDGTHGADGSGTNDSGSDDPEAGTDSEGSDESDQALEEGEGKDGSLWDLIHPWQYRGQYVQSGGDVRDEQERALRDIQRQAEEIEGSEVEHEPPAEK